MNINISSEYRYNQQLINTTFNDINYKCLRFKINLNPDYQREVVWSKDKMEGLIESIINGYYVPPIILNLINGKYNCIDGKQRISTIIKFLNNEICYNIGDNDLHFNDFDEQSKESFLNRSFQTCLYQDLDYLTELEIFRRVQKGEPMTKMEIIRSYNTELIIKLCNNTLKYLDIFKHYNIRITRDNHLNYILRCLILEYKKEKGFITLTIPEIQKFIESYYEKYNNNEVENNFYKNLDLLFKFLDNNKDKLIRNSKILTILEFIFIYKLILDNNLKKYKNNFINFYNNFESKCQNKSYVTAYTPLNLNKYFDIMIQYK